MELQTASSKMTSAVPLRGQHGATFVKIMTNVQGHYTATREAVTRTAATTCPAQYSA